MTHWLEANVSYSFFTCSLSLHFHSFVAFNDRDYSASFYDPGCREAIHSSPRW